VKGIDGIKEVLYFNGAIGSQIGPGGDVWEVTSEHPLGDGTTLPPGAVAVPYNFRKSWLIGHQLAVQVADFVTRYEVAQTESVQYLQTATFSRLTNVLFKIGLVPQSALGGDPTLPLVLGYALRDLYVCTGSPATEANCVSDNYAFEYKPLPVRVGGFAKCHIQYARLGNLQLVSMPGEFSPELVIGVPADFDTPEGTSKYYLRPDLHPVEAAYKFPGTIYSSLNCTHEEGLCFTLGLTGDEMGYVFPVRK